MSHTPTPRTRARNRGHAGSGLTSYTVPLPPSTRNRLAALLERYTYRELCLAGRIGQKTLKRAVDGGGVTHETAARLIALLDRLDSPEELDELDMPSWYR